MQDNKNGTGQSAVLKESADCKGISRAGGPLVAKKEREELPAAQSPINWTERRARFVDEERGWRCTTFIDEERGWHFKR